MKQKDLAKLLGISKSYLSMILSGKRRTTSEIAEKLQSLGFVGSSQELSLEDGLAKEGVEGSNPFFRSKRSQKPSP